MESERSCWPAAKSINCPVNLIHFIPVVMKVLVTSLILVFLLQTGATAREIIPFNKNWSFKKGAIPTDPVKSQNFWTNGWETVELPHTWNAKDMQVNYNKFYAGDGFYRKTFTVPDSLKNKRIYIRFEGVGQVTDLYVNNIYAGNHKGGYSAFTFDLTPMLKSGQENEILVKANNAARPDVIPVNHSLFGIYGGIYRPVSLIITEDAHIAVEDYASPGVYITQHHVSAQKADIGIKVKLRNHRSINRQIEIETAIYNREGQLQRRNVQTHTLFPQGMQTFQTQLSLSRPRLWQGRKDPYLYKVVVSLRENGRLLDRQVQPLGIRKYEIIAGKGFFLNGQKYPMYGVCRHQDWWELGSALHNEQHDFDLATIMDIGATTVRFAHYQQSDYIYSKCDSLGLIIWAEIPFVNAVTTQEKENAKEQLRELIRQSFNHPSIYVWGLHNEVYSPENYTVNLTRELHDLAKTEDPGRYTASVNGYGRMEHPVNLQADIQGMNRYFGWYEKKIQDMIPWVEGLEQNYPECKLMLTEYGADANLAHQTEYLGESLNWTKEFYPETFQTKTLEYHWGVICKHPYNSASYVWNTFDFAVPMWKRGGVPARNMKGLVTFDRKIKKDGYFWYKANWSEDPVLYITQRRLKQREKQETVVTVYSNRGIPHLYLNGQELPAPKKGYTDVHYIFEGVLLQKGINHLKATVGDLSDSIEWVFGQERKAGEAETLNNNAEHHGF